MKKVGLLAMPLMAVSFLVSCGPTTYSVSFGEIDGISITPNRAKKGEDYSATIAVNIEKIDEGLPDTLSKVMVGDKELTSDDYTYTVHEDRLSADFIIPNANVTGNIVISLNPVCIKINSQKEYEDAMLMKGITYLQVNGTEKGQYQEKYSPNVYYHHSLQETEKETVEKEAYVEHADNTYWEYTKEDGKWFKKETTCSELKTVANFVSTNNLDDIIKDCPYSALSYKNGYYFSDMTIGDITGRLTFQFLDKKLVHRDISTSDMNEYFYLTYEEITPDLPIPDVIAK